MGRRKIHHLTNVQKDYYVQNMVRYLPSLRACLGVTQEDLAKVIGLSRFTLVEIERETRTMKWSTFLALLLIFSQNAETSQLLDKFGIKDFELSSYLML